MSIADDILSKVLSPTAKTTAEIRATVPPQIRRRAFFSAQVEERRYLRMLHEVVADYSNGRINETAARTKLRECLAALGYDPATGGFEETGEAVAGIKDLSSFERIRLQVVTNRTMAVSAANSNVLNEISIKNYPGWRLARFGQRNEARPDWQERWDAAGESVGWEGASRTAMIALVSSPIWQALGDGEGGYEDTLNNPFPPFAFNSGMGWFDAARAECIAAGLDPDEAEVPEKIDLAPSEGAIEDVAAAFGQDFADTLEFDLEDME